MSKDPFNVENRGVRSELKTINETLQQRCGSSYKLKLSLFGRRSPQSTVYDDTSDAKDLLLCLYNGKGCVSSVTGRYAKSSHSMELLSKTAPEYEGLKFNLFLRTVFMYLMCFFRPAIKTIVSHSMNPISTYAMYKHYHASNPDLEEYVKKHHLSPSTFKLEDAKRVHTYVNEKYNTVKHAQQELEYMLEEGTLEEVGGWETEEEAIDFIMKTMNVRAITLQLDLTAQSVQSFLKQKTFDMQIQCSKTSSKSGTRKGGTRKTKVKNTTLRNNKREK